jgi:hypothetical protein
MVKYSGGSKIVPSIERSGYKAFQLTAGTVYMQHFNEKLVKMVEKKRKTEDMYSLYIEVVTNNYFKISIKKCVVHKK